jgi:hypothetical protein
MSWPFPTSKILFSWNAMHPGKELAQFSCKKDSWWNSPTTKSSKRHLGQSIHEKEILYILHVMDLWRPYLLGHLFQIKIDHYNLKNFLEQRISSQEKKKWVTKLFGYDYNIVYKNDKENMAVDALFRKYEEEGSFISLSFIITG